jgi:hypothetical protein
LNPHVDGHVFPYGDVDAGERVPGKYQQCRKINNGGDAAQYYVPA